MTDNQTAGWPVEGEVWRSDQGAQRHVQDVDDDGYSVTYSRPADRHADWRTCLMRDWLLWVNGTNAVRMRKPKGALAKDWGYATND